MPKHLMHLSGGIVTAILVAANPAHSSERWVCTSSDHTSSANAADISRYEVEQGRTLVTYLGGNKGFPFRFKILVDNEVALIAVRTIAEREGLTHYVHADVIAIDKITGGVRSVSVRPDAPDGEERSGNCIPD